MRVRPWQGVAMSTRSILVFYPGYPFDWGALVPQREAAAAAASLIDAGHQTVVRDYGTLDTLERLTPPDRKSTARSLANRIRTAGAGPPLSSLPAFVELTRLNAKFRKQQRRHCEEIGKSLARAGDTDFIGLLVQSADDAHCAQYIAAAVKASNAEATVVAFGPFIEHYGAELSAHMPAIDWMCCTSSETGLTAFAECSRGRARWSSLHDATAESMTADHWSGPFASMPVPAYDAETYPSAASPEKLLVFDVQDSVTDPEGGIKLRPVEDICNHIWELRAQFGASLIRFTGAATPALHFRSVLNGLGRRRLDILYSRRQTPQTADPTFFPVEFASGCVVQTHEVFSGSQWLHDRFYRSGWTITQLENMLRASKETGMETVAQLTFPCPADDYHTRDETMRLMRRTLPHAASVRLPRLSRASRWHRDAKRHGFEIPRKGLAANAMNCRAMFPLANQQWDRVPYGMRGRAHGQLQSELDALRFEFAEIGVQSFDGEVAALVRAATSATTGQPEPVPTHGFRRFFEFDTFVGAVDSCRGMAAAARDNERRLASAELRPVAGDE